MGWDEERDEERDGERDGWEREKDRWNEELDEHSALIQDRMTKEVSKFEVKKHSSLPDLSSETFSFLMASSDMFWRCE